MDSGSLSRRKNLLVVNTGSIKKRFVFQRLSKVGVNLIVLNKDKNWAQPYVQQWILADTYNHVDCLQNIKDFFTTNPETKIDGAVTFWEDDVTLLARICHEFKFVGNSIETSINTRNKFKMQEVFKKCGLPYINHYLLKSKSDLDQAIRDIGFPAVIKPVYGADCQFVVYISNEQEAKDAYSYVSQNCTPEFDPIYRYNKRLFLYQEFVDGHEFSLEAYSQHGIPHIVGIHEKTAMNSPFFMEIGDYLPPRIEDEDEQKLTKLSESALIVLGVRDSLAYVEVKMTKHGLKIIEASSRMGGDYTYENIKEIYDVDLIDYAVKIALCENIVYKPKDAKKCIVSKYFLPYTSGVITKIRGFDELKAKKNVVASFLGKEVGDATLLPPDGYDSIGWVSVKGSSYSDAERTIDNIFDRVSIDVSPFRSYSSVGRTIRRSRFAPALINKKGIARFVKIKSIGRVSREKLRKLHVGIACNIYEDATSSVEKDLMSVGKNIEKTLVDRGYRVTFFDFNNLTKAFSDLRESDVDIVFNVCERINNSSLLEPHAAAFLDMLQIPYTGSNPFTLALCIDKIRVKKLLAFHKIPTPRWDYAYSMEDEISRSLRYPLIVKPANTDNSIGVTNESVVINKKELERQLKKVILEIGSPALVEEYIEGDEYDVSIMGSDEDDLWVLPLSRSIFKNMPEGYWHIYAYDSKWSDDPAYNRILTQRPPKNVSRKLQSLISEISLDTYRILDCHDYGRVELRVDSEGNPFVLELNPNPSININDCVPYVAEIAGMDYGDFLEEIIRMTIRRYKNKPPYYHLQTSPI